MVHRRPPRAHEAVPRAVTTTAWVTALAVPVMAGLAVLGGTVPSLWGHLVIPTVAGAGATMTLAWRATRARRDRQEWVAWLSLSAAVVAIVAAEVLPELATAGIPEPPRGLADAAGLALYPLVYVGLGRLLRMRVLRWHPSLWWDGPIAALALLAGATHVEAGFLRPLPTDPMNTLVDLVGLGGGVGLVCMLAGSGIILVRRADLQWVLLATGTAITAFGAVVRVLVEEDGVSAGATGPDVALVTGAALMCLASVVGHVTTRVAPQEPEHPRLYRWGLLALPVSASVVACAVLAGGWVEGPTAQLSRGLSVLVLALSWARALLTYRELWAAVDRRRGALCDDLTGLANRSGLVARGEAVVARAAHGRTREGVPRGAGVLLVNLAGLREVNDSLGHRAGDRLVEVVAKRLDSHTWAGVSVVARVSGEEFAVLLAGVDGTLTHAAALRVHEVLAEPVPLAGLSVHVAARVGAAVAPAHGGTVDEVLRRAGIAMARARAEHAPYALYDPDLADAGAEDRVQRMDELHTALRGHQLVLHYQPQVQLATGRVLGVEALVRWDLPGRGLQPPGSFLPLADSAGLMAAVTEQVLEMAVDQASRWHLRGRPLRVSVNLPAAAVVDPGLPGRLVTLLDQAHLPAAYLQVEITESTLMGDRGRAVHVLASLRDLGVSVAIDDYGTGYSSLAYLRDLPVDELKLDRAFIAPMVRDPRAAVIVHSTIDLGHALGLTVVAEGVEDLPAAEALTALGCDAAQGFLYAKPMPGERLEDWLDHHQTHRTTRSGGAGLPHPYRTLRHRLAGQLATTRRE